MSGYYDEDIAMVLELIAEAGQVCQWHKDTVTLTDPDKPWLGGTSVPAVHTPSIAFVPASDTGTAFGLTKFRKGDDTTQFSTFGLMGPQDFDPLSTDMVMRGGAPLVIASVDVIQPNEQIVLYILSIV